LIKLVQDRGLEIDHMYIDSFSRFQIRLGEEKNDVDNS
jgi:hypothetical protein